MQHNKHTYVSHGFLPTKVAMAKPWSALFGPYKIKAQTMMNFMCLTIINPKMCGLIWNNSNHDGGQKWEALTAEIFNKPLA